MIYFNNISKSYKEHFWSSSFYALTDLSFTIDEGKLIGFLGANGAGKTTSIKVLLDFISPDSGEVKFDASFAKNKREFFRALGYLPERPYFYPYLTGREFLAYLGNLSSISKATREKNIKKYAPGLAIEFALDRALKTYSKGMLQRVGMLSALIHDPKLVILDEPLSGLDPRGRKEFKDILKELHREGKTVFFSSHIVSDVEEICDSVVVIDHGKLLYQGNIDRLILEHQVQEYEIHYKQKGSEKIDIDRVSSEEKNRKIKNLVDSSVDIIAVRYNVPSLEEVVYHIKE